MNQRARHYPLAAEAAMQAITVNVKAEQRVKESHAKHASEPSLFEVHDLLLRWTGRLQPPARDQLTCDELMDQTLEQWRPVVGYEGLYEVSDQGRVRSLDRLDRKGRRVRGRIRKPQKHSMGYLCVNLCNGEARNCLIHHLVAAAFISPRPEGLQVLHGAGGPRDNSVSNLSYGTAKQNMGPDRLRDGTSNRGEQHGLSKITAGDVLDIRWLVAMGAYQRDVATAYGIKQPTVSNIITKKSWAHVA